jgi:DNA-binding CsgD family transcriptional regulator
MSERGALLGKTLALGRRDLWRLSDAIKLLHAQTTLDDVARTAVGCVEDLVGCDWASVSLASPRFTQTGRFWSRYSAAQERTAGAFAAFYHQHPNWRSFFGSLRPRAIQLLKVSTPHALDSLPINHEVFRPLSITNIVGVCMPNSSMFAVGAAWDRRRLFSGRDELVMEVLSDQLVAAARAIAAKGVGAERDVAGRVEFVALDPRGRVVGQSVGARAMLGRFFQPSRSANRLPDAVESWLTGPSPEPALRVASDRRLVEIRRFDPRVRPGCCLALFEQDVSGGWVTPSGLTPRETEIARWVVAGKTSAEIGSILSISDRTVHKHLEHVFDKLGVHNRAGLVAEFLERRSA